MTLSGCGCGWVVLVVGRRTWRGLVYRQHVRGIKSNAALVTDDMDGRSDARSHTQTQITEKQMERVKNCEAFHKIDLSFSDSAEAYKSRSTLELFRALLVLKLCSYDFFVDNGMMLMKRMRQVFGKRLFEMLMKWTIYGQFVGGEDEEKIRPLVNRMRQYGVKSILDYSVEADISTELAISREMGSCEANTTEHITTERFKPHKEFGDRRKDVISARTFFYESEAQCERNTEIFMDSIEAVSGVTGATGFAAVKLTALGRPQFLMQLSDAIIQTRKFFELLYGTADRNYIFTHKISKQEFHERLKELGSAVREDVADEWFTIVDDDDDDMIDMSSWNILVNLNFDSRNRLAVPDIKSGTFQYFLEDLTEQETQGFRNMVDRLLRLCEFARYKDVRLMIDAEQSYFQPAVSRLTLELMKMFNKEKAIVFTTHQCYLKDAFSILSTDLNIAKKYDIYFGAKLVRGAYMDQERSRARNIGYEDPINSTYDQTTSMYQSCLKECMRNISERGEQKVAIMVASHNEDTVRTTISLMKEYAILPEQKVICFGQLLGMCDQVSYSLGQAGFSVYKYVPYGPVTEVLPYLSRRAQENRSLLKGAEKERKLLLVELMNRLKSGRILYKPNQT